ncbi:MAG: cyclase family protein [Anaerovoracaceae bacterium]
MKLYDLSVPFEANPYAEPWVPEIEWSTHEEQADSLAKKIGISPDDFQDRMALAGENVKADFFCHVGTHVDAPIHFGPMSGGNPARTIDQIDISEFYGDGVIFDMRHKKPAEGITVEDLQKDLDKMDYTIKPGDIALIMTGMDKLIYTDRYLPDQPGMTGEATEWLIDQGIKLMGIDAYTFDRPFGAMVADVKAGHKENLFPAHFMSRKKEYYHIEKLANLDTVPVRHGFKVAAFPVKVKNGSAGAARVVAMVE